MKTTMSQGETVSHTSGEWKLDKEQCVSMRDQAQMLLEDIGTEREWVAVGLEDCDGFAEVIAMTHPQNARLIAAAPDLLEACKVAFANLKNLYSSDHLVIKSLRNALEKAGAL